jgi:hypothetical protein
MQGLGIVIGLGVLGLDPLGALLMISAHACGAKRGKVLAFTLAFLLFTQVLGVACALLGSRAIDQLLSLVPGDESPAWAVVYAVTAAALVVWVVRRAVRRHENKPEKQPGRLSRLLSGSTLAFIAGGMLWACSSFSDPTFYAVILASAEAPSLLGTIFYPLLWIYITQIPLIALIIGLYLGVYDILVSRVSAFWQRHRSKVMVPLYLLALAAAAALAFAAVTFLATGTYLF